MKIEFRKVPLHETEFSVSLDSVKFTGTFSKISSQLAKVEGRITGETTVDCCKCGTEFTVILDEKGRFLISDGIYSSDKDEQEDVIVVEVEDHIIDFDELLHSEIESYKSEYYICDSCKQSDDFVEIEY
jgi:uncharacterized metal-binding protein YceD (DUF177 family)